MAEMTLVCRDADAWPRRPQNPGCERDGGQSMGRNRSKVPVVLLSLVWLAVVLGAVTLVVVRREEYGFQAYVTLGIAALMLVVFVIALLPRRLQRAAAAESLGTWATGGLILLIVLTLAGSLVKGFPNLGLFGSLVLLLFLAVFIEIFIRFIREHTRGKSKRGKADTNPKERK